jgi:hypothetical protein
MTINRNGQIGIALAAAVLSVALAFIYATYFGAFAFFLGWFIFFRTETFDEKHEDYKLVKHLCGLAAWCVLVLLVGGHSWTRPEEARAARVFESCVAAGMPGKCNEALERIYGPAIPTVAMAISSSVDWRKPVASCRLKTDFTQCIEELTQVTDGTSVTVTRDDVTRLCKGADRAECFGELQKQGLVYSNLAIDDAPAAPTKKD